MSGQQINISNGDSDSNHKNADLSKESFSERQRRIREEEMLRKANLPTYSGG